MGRIIPSKPINTESARQRAKRDFRHAVGSPWFIGWFVVCEAAITGGSIYWANSASHSAGAQALVGVAALLAAAVIALGSGFVAVWVTAPTRQRDEARLRIAELETTSGFPDVVIEPKPALVVETRQSKTFPAHRETLITVGIRATNREMERRAILSFTAHVQTDWPTPSVRKLSRVVEGASLPNPWKLGPQDEGEGEVFFSWLHDMDFILKRDISEEEAIEMVMGRLGVSVKDTLSRVSVAVELPDGWMKL